MWTCPVCGRTFQHAHQDHYCGEAPATIEAYIAQQPAAIQPLLLQVNDALRTALPDAVPTISWRMPTYRSTRNILHFAAFRRHLGLYPGPEAVAHFSAQLTGYKTSKGAIQFPYTQPLPLALITDIAVWCAQRIHP